MAALKGLRPEKVFEYFEKLCSVPHGSGNTKIISDLCVGFAKELGLRYRQEACNNLIIWKDGSAGYEQSEPIILQGHIDMVCAKTDECAKDMAAEGLDLRTDGEWVWADQTSLGGDNGIAVAMILAILADDTLPHPPLEAVFTVDEEVGMDGAFALDCSDLKGKKLLNLDSEEEGELYVGCAGGVDANITFKYKAEPTPARNYRAVKLVVKGLKGGHSGIQIVEQRANANKLLVRFIREAVASYEARLASWEGGNMRNAIPRECEVVITVPAEEEADVLEFVQECEALWNEEYHVHETPISFKAERVELPAMMVPDEIKDNLVDAIYACQNGVMRMIPTIPDTVETSSNLAIVSIGGGKAEIKILARSSRDSMKDYLNTALESCFSMAGMEVTRSGGYSGWEPNVDSPILKAMKESYKAQFGTEPAVKVIHAGLECGIIGAVVPGLDMISFGPTLRSPHSPDERCFIPSVGKFYDFVVATLENTPVKE